MDEIIEKPLKFKKENVDKAIEYFKEVHMTEEQHRIFKDFVKIFIKHIPTMDEISAKGIGWSAVRIWQIEHKRDLTGLEAEDEVIRILGITQLMDVCKRELTKILKDPNQKALLDRTTNSEYFNPYGESNSYNEDLKKEYDLPDEAEWVYFIGCTSNYRQKDLRDATLSFLKKSGISFTLVD